MNVVRVHPASMTHVRAFTLVEVVAVVVILGILAVATLPALGRMNDARIDAAADAIESEAIYARSVAMATGRPAGLAIDISEQLVTTVVLHAFDGVIPARGATGLERDPIEINVLFRGAEIEHFVAPDGGAGSGVVWFSHTGTPQTRDRDGLFIADAAHDSEIVMNNGNTIVVAAGGGAVVLSRSGGGL